MQSTLRHTVALAALLAVASPVALAAQNGARETDNTFDWSAKIPAGSWLRVRNLNGPVDVESSSSDVAEVHAVKHARGDSDPKRVHFVVTNDGSNVTICALWNEGDTCDADGYHSHHDGDDDHQHIEVAFTVKLPKGVKMNAGTVNGDVTVRGAEAPVTAHTVNGTVEAATTTGPLDASTVNGNVSVSMDALSGDGDLNYSTVNGSIVARLPAHLDAEVDMQTVNGSLASDYPLTLTGRINPRRHLHAVIGNGGRQIRLHTVNGSIELKKPS